MIKIRRAHIVCSIADLVSRLSIKTLRRRISSRQQCTYFDNDFTNLMRAFYIKGKTDQLNYKINIQKSKEIYGGNTIARAPKPIALQSSKMGKEEKERRKEAEDKLKGNDDKVYTPPQGMNSKIAEIYMNIVEELRHAKVLNNLDVDLISITADSIYRLGVARRNLDEQGEVIADFNGKLMKSPWVQITKDYQAIFHAGVRELGLSPSSRAKLAMYHVEANADTSEEDELFDSI